MQKDEGLAMAKGSEDGWQTISDFVDLGLKANVAADVTHTPIRDNNFNWI